MTGTQKYSTVSSEQALSALSRVCSSQEFEGADRLKDFLSYVVRESVEGRSDKILGKNIAEDVYGRRNKRDRETANVVRVDAGRLRRRLEAYYQNEGAGDEVRIYVDRGGYAPRFTECGTEVQQEPMRVSDMPNSNGNSLRVVPSALTTFALVAAVYFAWAGVAIDVPTDAETDLSAQIESGVPRGVLYEASPAALQAYNLADEARRMLFPATQPTRLLAALTLFDKAIELNPTYSGGYAGAAQASAMYGGLAPLGANRDKMMAKAREYAETAVALDPFSSWTQSSMAFVNLFERNFEEANRLSQRAVSLGPEDLIALEIDAIIAFFSGDFERARASSAPELHVGRPGIRFPWRNVYGNASFYLGEYKTAVENLLAAIENGGPVSEINSAHLIASLHASGRTQEAERYLSEFVSTWPESRIAEFMHRLFANPEDAETLLFQLRQVGWAG